MMSKLIVLSLSIGLTVAVASTAQAQTDLPEWNSVCAHLGELWGSELTEGRCVEIRAGVSADCNNPIEVMECMLAATDQDELAACQHVCGEDQAPAHVGVVCRHVAELANVVPSGVLCDRVDREIVECGDQADATVHCILDATDMTDFEACEEICNGESTSLADLGCSALCTHLGDPRSVEACLQDCVWEPVCEHLCGLLSVEPTRETCARLLRIVAEDCGDNTDATIHCIAGASDLEAYEACGGVCEQ